MWKRFWNFGKLKNLLQGPCWGQTFWGHLWNLSQSILIYVNFPNVNRIWSSEISFTKFLWDFVHKSPLIKRNHGLTICFLDLDFWRRCDVFSKSWIWNRHSVSLSRPVAVVPSLPYSDIREGGFILALPSKLSHRKSVKKLFLFIH